MGSDGRAGRFLAAVLVAIVAISCSSSGGSQTGSTSTTPAADSSPTSTSTAPAGGLHVAETTAPAGFSVPSATWISITRPDGATQLAAIFRPTTGTRPSPVVVALHGSSGLSKLQLEWAPKLAAAGFVVVVGCYLDADPVSAQQSPGLFMPCPGLPDAEHATSAAEATSYRALLDAATGLTHVKSTAIGAAGVSEGAIVALSTDDPRIKAIAADSGYRKGAGTTAAPVLLLGMTNDPNVDHSRLVTFEQNQRNAGKSIQARYYPGTGHVTTFQPTVGDDATNRIITFLQQYLR